jgi:acetyltransferase-like isoleucine patch superfamily enzyme
VRTWIRNLIREHLVRLLRSDPVSWAAHQMMSKPMVIGDRSRLHMHETVPRNEMLINLTSGSVTIGAQSFCGQFVTLLAATHDHHQFGRDRLMAVPTDGLDIVIGEGVWLASCSTVLGPCRIGDHAVVAAGALVRDDVPPYAIVAGVPARIVGSVRPEEIAQNGMSRAAQG